MSLLLHQYRLLAGFHYPAHIQILSLLHHLPNLDVSGYHIHLGTEVVADNTAEVVDNIVAAVGNTVVVAGSNNSPVVAGSSYSLEACNHRDDPNHDDRGVPSHDDRNRHAHPNHHRPQTRRKKTKPLKLLTDLNKVISSWHYSYLVIVNVVKNKCILQSLVIILLIEHEWSLNNTTKYNNFNFLTSARYLVA
jgi:hypothetical protein